MRNRNRQPGPIRRNLIAPPPAPTLGTSPALRTPERTVVTGPGPRIGRAHGGGMPAGNGSGMSDWHRPANLSYALSVTTHEARWSATAYTNRPA